MGKRRGWFDVGWISTQRTPADLDTKLLPKERRGQLCNEDWLRFCVLPGHTMDEERLKDQEAAAFRSGLGVCI